MLTLMLSPPFVQRIGTGVPVPRRVCPCTRLVRGNGEDFELRQPNILLTFLLFPDRLYSGLVGITWLELYQPPPPDRPRSFPSRSFSFIGCRTCVTISFSLLAFKSKRRSAPPAVILRCLSKGLSCSRMSLFLSSLPAYISITSAVLAHFPPALF